MRKHGAHMEMCRLLGPGEEGRVFVGVEGSNTVTEGEIVECLHSTRRASCLGRGPKRGGLKLDAGVLCKSARAKGPQG